MHFTLTTTETEKRLALLLSKQLDQTEADIDNNVDLSPEFLEDYVKSAIFLSKTYGRKGDRVIQAEMLLSELAK